MLDFHLQLIQLQSSLEFLPCFQRFLLVFYCNISSHFAVTSTGNAVIEFFVPKKALAAQERPELNFDQIAKHKHMVIGKVSTHRSTSLIKHVPYSAEPFEAMQRMLLGYNSQ